MSRLLKWNWTNRQLLSIGEFPHRWRYQEAKWSSSKKSVVSVSSGKVKGKKAWTAYIYAKVGKRTLKCKVIVKELDKAKRLSLAKKEAKKIVKKYVTADLSTKERAFVLFRYLTEHCSWQLNQSSEAYQKNYGNEAYAALVMKKAACSGYAKAYTLLCEAANVPVRHVNAGSWTHQWNEVKVNRKWIKVDAYGGIFADTTGIRKSLRTSAEEQEQLVFHFTIARWFQIENKKLGQKWSMPVDCILIAIGSYILMIKLSPKSYII